MKHELDDSCHLLTEVVWDSRELAFDYLFVKTLHVVCSEWGHKGTHLIEDATEGPDITLAIIGLVTPDFRTGIIRSASLCVAEAF